MSSLRNHLADSFYSHYQRISRTPSKWLNAAIVLRANSDPERRSRLSQRIWALRLPVFPLGEGNDQLIEALIVVAPKDFDILPFSIEGVIRNAGHPISRLVLIVPEAAITEALQLIKPWETLTECVVIGEDSIIPENSRIALRKVFGNRYGWILQQLLCVAYTSSSDAQGVLLMDSDTVLTRKRTLLDSGKQLLMVSLEHHDPYYEFLNSLHPLFGIMNNTFVTHHMIEQPMRLREILELTCGGGIQALIEKLLELADAEAISSVCVDFELYAQAMVKLDPDNVVYAKWSNTSAPRAEALLGIDFADIEDRFKDYCSVSFHSYT